MSNATPAALGISDVLLRLLRIFNIGLGVLIVAMLIGSFVFEPVFVTFFTKRPASISPGLLMPTLRLWMVIAIPMIGVVHVMLTRLLAMIAAVRAGTPFAPENAVRLKTIAWCLLALQLFNLLFGVLAATMNAAGSRIEWSHSWNGWLAVVLVFVLAQVFEEGARNRADLDAMI